MVGGESRGCRTCKQRKIKCDERSPICRRCEKSKRVCTGVESEFRFYYGSEAHKTEMETAISIAHLSSQRQVPTERWRTRLDPTTHVSPATMPDSGTDRSRRLLVFALEYQVSGSYGLQQLGSYFGELPARIGQSPALDAVIECFVTSYARRYLPLQERPWDSEGRSAELVVYGNAIASLRNALNDPCAQESEETLCAALSLFLYEFFMQEPTRQCVSLAGGVSSILKAWGPSRITSPFSLTLFESHHVTMIAHALVFGKECFIAEDGWEKVFQACPNIAPDDRAIWLTLARIPSFLDNVRQVLSDSSMEIDRVIKQGHHLRQLILALNWHTSKALSQSHIYHQAPELYTGSSPTLQGCASESKEAHDMVARVAFIRAGSVAVNGALRRLGEAGIDWLLEDHRNTDWLCRSMPVAERFGVLNGSFFSLAAVAAFGLANDQQRTLLTTTVSKLLAKCAQRNGESTNVSEEQYRTTYAGLWNMHDVVTGGPIVRDHWHLMNR